MVVVVVVVSQARCGHGDGGGVVVVVGSAALGYTYTVRRGSQKTRQGCGIWLDIPETNVGTH